MNKVELLAPAGSMDALKAAISFGADAVYLGGLRFGARSFAHNFSNEELQEAVIYAHLRGVKIYVTVNTLIYESELLEVKSYIDFLYHIEVDAVIVQDLGLFELIKENYPDFEIHCSTQMHVHNVEGAKLMKRLGASRVVLARESGLPLIKKVVKEGIEVETFVHGALCMSYSGQCLMSSFQGGRSGNRGQCAQPCRLNYTLLQGDKKVDEGYLLSLKDLYTLEHVDELITAGIHSFKIEGRMKRSEYVGEVVRIYRQAIDNFYHKQAQNTLAQDKESLMKLFNRSFSKGYVFNDNNLLNTYRPNHMGINIAKIVQINNDKIQIKLNHSLNQGDGIRILNKYEDYGMLVNKILKDSKVVEGAHSGDVVELPIKRDLKLQINDEVVLTSDSKQLQTIQNNIKPYYKRIQLFAKVSAKIGSAIVFSLSDLKHSVSVVSEETVSQAKTSPLLRERLLLQLSKINDTPYEIHFNEVDIDDEIFFSLKALNELKRKAIKEIDEARIKVNRTLIKVDYPVEINRKPIKNLLISITTAIHKEVLSNVSNSILFSSRKNLCNNEDVFYKGLRVNEQSEEIKGSYVLASQLGDLYPHKQQTIIADSSFNVCNSYSVRLLEKCGVSGVVASLEASDKQIKDLIEGYQIRYHEQCIIGKVIYGHREAMIMKTCIIRGQSDKLKCCQCQSDTYKLRNTNNVQYIVFKDDHCHNILLEEKAYVDRKQHLGLTFKLLNFTIEDECEMRHVLSSLKIKY